MSRILSAPPLLDYYYDGESNTSSDFEIRRNVVWNVLNSAIRNIFENNNLVIPRALTGYDYGCEYWLNGMEIVIEVLNFFENLLLENLKCQYCDQKVLEEVVVERWNFFLMDSFGLHHLCHQVHLKAFLERIKDHSIYKSIALENQISVNDVNSLFKNMFKALIIESKKINRVIIYGMGEHCKKFVEYFKFCNIVACVDKNMGVGTFAGMTIRDPMTIGDKPFEAILISSTKFYEEIKRTLIEKNRISEKVIYPIEILRLKNQIISRG